MEDIKKKTQAYLPDGQAMELSLESSGRPGFEGVKESVSVFKGERALFSVNL